MMADIPRFALVLDTDAYAGNFEREMCAYATGHIGECGKGEKQAALFEKDGLEIDSKYIGSFPDEHGCCRPVSIFLSLNGKDYNSVAYYLYKIPPNKLIALWVERSRAFATDPRQCGAHEWQSPFKILGVRLVEQKVVVTTLKNF